MILLYNDITNYIITYNHKTTPIAFKMLISADFLSF